MTLRDLPPVRALAEERARRLYDALYIPGATSPWDFVPGQMREHLTGGQLAILCNLRDNPDSRDAVARLVAEKAGIECGATAPTFWRWTPAGGGWALGSGGPDAAEGVAIFHSGNILAVENSRGQTWRTIAGISAITDPAEALARAAIAVLA